MNDEKISIMILGDVLTAALVLVLAQFVGCGRTTCTPDDVALAVAAYKHARDAVDKLPANAVDLPSALEQVETAALRLRRCTDI